MFLASSFVALGTYLSENENFRPEKALGFPNAQSEIVRESQPGGCVSRSGFSYSKITQTSGDFLL